MERNRRAEAKRQLAEKRAAVGRPDVLPAYEFLYQTHTESGEIARFKVAKGGRGKGASWAIADRLLDKSHMHPSLILCTREVQNSIADSVHRLLVNRIRQLGYSEFFHSTNHSIKNLVTGSEFLFRGLNDLTVDSVKSMEGITDVWLAEAHNVGAKSWLVLEPTIRTEGSTLYVDYNPDAEDAPTNVKFTTECPDNAIVRHLTYKDNPYFPDVLEKLRQQAYAKIENAQNEEAREQMQLDYNHVWLGATRKINKASIFGAHYVVEAFIPLTDAGEWDGPYDGADWGFSQDPTVRIRCWIHTKLNGRKRLCIEREAYGVGVELNDLPAMFDVFPDSRKTRIRADNARPETISHMKNAGFNIMAADKWKGSVEDGIEHMRGAYDVIVVHPRCTETEKEMKLYSYKVDRLTKEILTDTIDAWNHCLTADTLVETDSGAIRIAALVGKTGMVKTLQGLKRFHNVRCTSRSETIYKIETDSGSDIQCTADHMILTDKGWIPAIALSPEYRIVSIDKQPIRYGNDKCQSILNTREGGITSAKTGITFAQCQSICIGKYGLSITASHRQGLIYTTKTMINRTMTSIISKSLLASSIKSIMKMKCCLKTGKNGAFDLSKISKIQPKNGINQMQAVNGIKNITKRWLNPCMFEFQRYVQDARNKLMSRWDARLHTALTLVNLVTGANKGSITFNDNVLNVESSLSAENIAIKDVAVASVPVFYDAIKKITKLSSEPVYNMEVEDVHHFAINGGLIVHNCIDAIRYALDPLITRKKGSHLFGKASGKPV